MDKDRCKFVYTSFSEPMFHSRRGIVESLNLSFLGCKKFEVNRRGY